MDVLSSKFNYNHLSVKDLVEARDLFHIHLINKKNVVATAIGRYRIRKTDPWPNQQGYSDSLKPSSKKPARTLLNSEVRDYSWPCLLVFVSEWTKPEELTKEGLDDLVPRSVYLPDGRIVPICVIESAKSELTSDVVNDLNIVFPSNYVGGGFPLLVSSQGVERIASIGCVVTDGNKYYAITNRHVLGRPGTPVYTRLKGATKRIGVSSDLQLGKTSFQASYQDWAGKNIMVNNDVGLVEIEDINLWKTDVLSIGQIGPMANLNTSNITLALISAVKPGTKETLPRLKAFGAVSGEIHGEVAGLFYRYKSVGGIEYVSDFLIGGVNGSPLNIHHGDSGTLWLLENNEMNMPIAIQWGQHDLIDAGANRSFPYALASNLTNTCVCLDVDIVRGWNIDNDYSWGKTGHFKIAAKACELVTNVKLSKLLMANQQNIGYVDADLLADNVVSGAYKDSKNVFVPLADVADIIWRTKRGLDDSNHFADIDEKNIHVFNNKTLLSLCLASDANIDVDVWLKYFADFDAVAPNDKPRNGALPFRVWQMYIAMIKSLKAKNLDEFVAIGGTMSHYVGDACQTLHISHLHHGRDDSEKDVHSDYETEMVDRKMQELFDGVNATAKKVKQADMIGASGKAAAKRIIQLMDSTQRTLSPLTVCKSYTKYKGQAKRFDKMWDQLGDRTITNVAEGCRVMAILWQSAWIAGNGDSIATAKLTERSKTALKKLYDDKEKFVPSYRLNMPEFKQALQ